jgi:hypothetical protein
MPANFGVCTSGVLAAASAGSSADAPALLVGKVLSERGDLCVWGHDPPISMLVCAPTDAEVLLAFSKPCCWHSMGTALLMHAFITSAYRLLAQLFQQSTNTSCHHAAGRTRVRSLRSRSLVELQRKNRRVMPRALSRTPK